MYEHKHAVWPTSAPSVSAMYWDQNAWERWENGYYDGARHDQKAWDEYRARKEREFVNRERKKYGLSEI